jgi:anti-anti-sigma factor
VNDHYAITGELVLRLAGEFDMDARAELAEAVLAAVADPAATAVTLDLARTTFLDSEALGAVITGMNAARAAGKPFLLINAGGSVRRVLDIAGVLELTGDRHGP